MKGNNPFDDSDKEPEDLAELLRLIEEAFEKSNFDSDNVRIAPLGGLGNMGSGKGRKDPFREHSINPPKEGMEPNKNSEQDYLMDEIEYDDEIVLVFDLSGFKEENITVDHTGNKVDIQAHKKISEMGEEKFKESVEVEEEITELETELNNGVLRISIPKNNS